MDTLEEEPGAWLRRIIRTWWPLAASWLLMGVEVPALSAIIARLANPEVNLAAYGGVVYPLSLIVEAPIIMLLAASTALCKDWASYRRVYRFMMITSATLTGLHILVAFTPLYDLVVRGLIGVPQEIIEPARLGLRLMVPWTWSIAFRRFQQGVMIRSGNSNLVGTGTIVRLTADAVVLAGGYFLAWPGIVVGAGAQAFGVICEAIYAGVRVRPILRYQLRLAPAVPLISWREFFAFYIPLALTSLLSLVWQPIGSAALSRLPLPVESLAVFPVVSGLIFILRSPATAFNEVVVSILERPHSYRSLRRFATLMAAILTVLPLLIAATPLSMLWFSRLSALPPDLARLARVSFWFSLPLPALTALQSWYQGAILYGRSTRGIPESVLAFFVTVLLVLGVGLVVKNVTGIYIGMIAFTTANIAQTIWLWHRSRPIMKSVRARDTYPSVVPVSKFNLP
jgi:hypothetical protein